MKTVSIKNLIFLLIIISGIALFSCASDDKTGDDSKDMSIEGAYWEDYSPEPYKWGWIDASNKIIIPAIYDDARDFSEGLAAVNFRGRWGYVDTKGHRLIAPQYMEARSFHEGKAAVKGFEGRMGFIEAHGDSLTAFKYIDAGAFKNGFAPVKTREGWGYINSTGKEQISPSFSKVWPFSSHHCARVKTDKFYQLINSEAQKINTIVADKIYAVSGGFYRFRKAGKWGLLDTLGQIALPASYDKITPSEDGIFILQSEGKAFLFPGLRPLNLPAGVSNPKYIGAGRIRFYKDTLVGMMDTAGKVLLEASLVQLNTFHNGLALCAKIREGAWNWIRPDGSFFWEQDFPLAWDFYDGKARIITRDGIGVMDTKKQVIIPPSYMELRDFKSGLARFQAMP